MARLKWLGKWFLILVVFLIAAHSLATFVLGQMLRAQVSKLEARGEPTSLAEVIGEPIPDSENAAVIYEEIFEEYEEPPLPGVEGGLSSFEWVGQRKTNPALWEEVRKALDSQKHIVDKIELAVSRPHCRFEVSTESPWIWHEQMSPKYAKMRKLARLLAANARFNADDGDTGEALRSVRLGFRLGDSLDDRPVLISFLVRSAGTSIPSAVLRDVLSHGGIAEGDAKSLFDYLGNVDIGESYAKAMAGERAYGLTHMEFKSRGILPDKTQYGIPPSQRLQATYTGSPYLYWRYLRMLKQTAKEIEMAGLPYAQTKGASRDPVYKRSRLTACRNRTEIAGSRTALALAAYRDRYGAYPAGLDDLDSKLGWELPEDPFTGESFKYARQGNGYVLYGVGFNLKDDGGSEEYENPRDPQEKKDIVWRMER